ESTDVHATIIGGMRAIASVTRLAIIASTFCRSASTTVLTPEPSRTHAGNRTAIPFCTVISAPLIARTATGEATTTARRIDAGIGGRDARRLAKEEMTTKTSCSAAIGSAADATSAKTT